MLPLPWQEYHAIPLPYTALPTVLSVNAAVRTVSGLYELQQRAAAARAGPLWRAG